MADRQPVDHLADIDTLLRTELAVEPSHEFLPRVRERIRTEPAPSRWRSLWIIAPLAASAVVVMAVAFSLRPGTPPAAREAPTTTVRPAPADPRPVPHEERLAKTEPRTAKSEPRTANREARTASSDVLIDPRQRDALASFVRLATQGTITGDSFKHTTEPPAVIEDQIKAIAVDPLAVSPIPPGGVLPSELERK
jgi:hypothetical protein